MMTVDSHSRSSLEALRCARTYTCLAGKDQIDSFRRGERDGEIDTLVRRAERIRRSSKVGLDYSLGTSFGCFVRPLYVGLLGIPISCRFRAFHSSDRRVVAFVRLKDRAAALYRTQSPFDAIPVPTLIDQRPARTRRFQVEPISDFSRGVDLHRREENFTEALRHGFQRITTGGNAGGKTAVGGRARLLNELVGAFANQLNHGARQRQTLVISNCAADGGETADTLALGRSGHR